MACITHHHACDCREERFAELERLFDEKASADAIYVRWYPPYSNGHKEQPVDYLTEAKVMVNWFRSINVQAEIWVAYSVKRELEYLK